MNLADIMAWLKSWIDAVAAAIISMTSLGQRKSVRVTEEDGGTFVIEGDRPASGLPFERATIVNGQLAGAHQASIETMLRGRRAELALLPSRFLFRPLELPQRATEFLDGVVRAQIDRLTPWTANDAAFGWSAPSEAGADRMVVTVAATARDRIQPLIEALTAAGADAVRVITTPPGAAPIQVLDHQGRASLDIGRVRAVLAAVLIGAGLLAGVSMSAAAIHSYSSAGRQEELRLRIAERRLAIRAGRDGAAQPATPLRALERRKYQTASSVIVLEVLSQILPDHTYVTELRIEGDRLRVIGVTRDAPGLIRLMEQSPNFTRATFFAPTTRAPTDPGERFHIEAQIEPIFGARS